MLNASNVLKASANAQFAAADYDSAISTYDKALAELPSYLDYELAVLQSNIAACHVKLEQWKEAVSACEKGLENLERQLPTKPKSKPKSKRKPKSDFEERANGNPNGPASDTDSEADAKAADPSATIVELPSDADDDELQAQLNELNLSSTRRTDITRIRSKLLLRRARSTSFPEAKWSDLGTAMADYTTLSKPPYFDILPLSDQKTVRKALLELGPRVEEVKQKEVGEMMGKLKEVGDGILGRFGLSTDMFKMVQGDGGGWNLSFDGQAGTGNGKAG
jgi:tetratricopeptide (TPR) repeat protein